MNDDSEQKYIQKFVRIIKRRFPSLSNDQARKLVDRFLSTMVNAVSSGYDLSTIKQREDGSAELKVYRVEEKNGNENESPSSISNISVEALNIPQVFLCHSSLDKPRVRKLYYNLQKEGLKPWLDEEDIIPGKRWEGEIRKAIRKSDFFLACLSKNAVDSRGYVHKEIRIALDVLDEFPEGKIFLIPARLEECTVPERLKSYQWVDLYKPNGFSNLLKALRYH